MFPAPFHGGSKTAGYPADFFCLRYSLLKDLLGNMSDIERYIENGSHFPI